MFCEYNVEFHRKFTLRNPTIYFLVNSRRQNIQTQDTSTMLLWAAAVVGWLAFAKGRICTCAEELTYSRVHNHKHYAALPPASLRCPAVRKQTGQGKLLCCRTHFASVLYFTHIVYVNPARFWEDVDYGAECISTTDQTQSKFLSFLYVHTCYAYNRIYIYNTHYNLFVNTALESKISTYYFTHVSKYVLCENLTLQNE